MVPGPPLSLSLLSPLSLSPPLSLPAVFLFPVVTWHYVVSVASQVCRGTAVTMVAPTAGAEEIANPFLQPAEDQ